MLHRFFFHLLLVAPALPAFSQSGADTAFVSAAVQSARDVYQRTMGSQSSLFNGSRYAPPEYSLEQHPFFDSDDWLTGNVFYDGEYFQNVFLMYDLSTRQLVTEHTPSGQAIQLVREKLDHFTILDHHFEKIDPASVNETLPAEDFYDILYAGETKLVARRQKIRKEEIEAAGIEIKFEEKNRYYFYKNGAFFPVRNKAGILKLMTDKKAEMKKFLKRQRLPFAQNREMLLTRLARHYDSLK